MKRKAEAKLAAVDQAKKPKHGSPAAIGGFYCST
jgi:hypothetical protein